MSDIPKEKIKRKYTKKVKPVVGEIPDNIPLDIMGEVPKQKRKYTKKVKIDMVEPVLEGPAPAVMELEPATKEKPKRKYTKKIKPAQEVIPEVKKPSPVSIPVPVPLPSPEIKKSSPVSIHVPSPVTKKPSPVMVKPMTMATAKELNHNGSDIPPNYTRRIKIIHEIVPIEGFVPDAVLPPPATLSPKALSLKALSPAPSPKPIPNQLEQMKIQIEPEIHTKIPKTTISKPSSPPSSKAIEKIEEFKQKGYSALEHYDKATIEEIIRLCKDAYYNKSTPLLSDNEYDIVEDYYKSKWHSEIAIGAAISGKNKISLPYKMASMDKIKPDSNALQNWMKTYKGPYVLSCKLDGVSGLYMCDENGKYHLYTRGDGTIGQDISYLIGPMKLPKIPKRTAIRGEFIISKSTFETKYKTKFANARNLVSGMVNRKGVDEKIADLHYVAYEVINPPMKPSEQLLFCKQHGCEVVQYQTVDVLSNEYLSATLVDWRSNYEYEIDGIIVTDNYIYPRVDGNPEHAFAFKMVLSDQVAEAKVVDVIWTPSKDGYLKPRVRVEPIQLAGVRIEYATGFNGKFIQDNNIGIGAIITMVRSGDVIPYIKSVTTPAEKPLMPSVPYKWTDTLVDILLENGGEDKTVLEKNIAFFFVFLEVEGLSSGNIKRMMEAGFNSIHSILLAKKEEFLKVEGFKQKMVDKIYNSIQEKVGKASLVDIVVASGKLGRGFAKKKLAPVFQKYPHILTSEESRETKTAMVKEVEGFGLLSAKEFVNNIPEVLEFLRVNELEHKLFETVVAAPKKGEIDHPLYGKKIVMTKTRDKAVIMFVENIGGIFEDTMHKDTFLLIVKSTDDKSSKIEYAKKNNIPVYSVEEFKEKYM